MIWCDDFFVVIIVRKLRRIVCVELEDGYHCSRRCEITNSGGRNGITVRENQTIEVTVEWDDKREVFELVAKD